MAEKKNNYETIVNALAESGLSDDEIAKAYPEIWAWWNSASDEASKVKRLESKMGNAKFQKELRDWDAFTNEDFSGYKETVVPSNMKEASIDDVEAWYKEAKKSIDPKGRLGNTELYNANGDATFWQLEDDSPEADMDWFSKLAIDLGYPDTAEGYNQLEKDIKTVFSRKRNADNANKYGGIVDFAMGNSMSRMKEGFRPTAGDVASDAVANAAWMTPFGKFIKPAEGAALALRIGTGLAANSVAPVINETAKVTLGSGKEDAGEALSNVGINTLVNSATPLQKLLGLAGRPASLLEKGLNLEQGELAGVIHAAAKSFGEKFPMLEAYVDNRLGNDVFANRMKRMATQQIKGWFGLGADKEE